MIDATLRRIARSSLMIITVTATAFAMANAAGAAEVKVLASGAMKEIYQELAPGFEKASGHKLLTTFAGTVDIKKKVSAGEPYDLVIVAAPEIDVFIKDGKLAAGRRLDIAKSAVGVAVKAGAPKPDLSSGDTVKKALLDTKSVAYSTGPSGVYVKKMIDRFGIAEQLKTKSKQTPPGTRVGELLARGDADLGFQQVSELIHESGIDFVGPLPADIQNITLFSSGIGATSALSAPAQALQQHLTSAQSVSVIKKNGMEPARLVPRDDQEPRRLR